MSKEKAVMTPTPYDNPDSAELWANAYAHVGEINYWIPGLRQNIQRARDEFIALGFPEAKGLGFCDAAQQIVTEIEKVNNEPLVSKPRTIAYMVIRSSRNNAS